MTPKVKWTLLVVLGIVAVMVIVKLVMPTGPQTVDSNAMRSKGDPNARVQVVEFIDFQCPACAAGNVVLKDFLAKFPKDMRVQVKYYPLARTHAHAMQAAVYGECAARQGKFWEFLNLLLPRQQQWSSLISADPVFMGIAKEISLDENQLTACLSSESVRQIIKEEQALGHSLGVQSTPTYFVNNKMLVGTKSLIDELNTIFAVK